MAKYGGDAFRYFLLREGSFGLDADFREEALVGRYNGDLANNLGNLVSRTLSMLQRYFQGELPPLARPEPIDRELESAFAAAERDIDVHVPNLQLNRALESLLSATDRANKYITETAPFTLAKSPAEMPRVGTILRQLAESLRQTARLAAPFLPETAARIGDLLGVPRAELSRRDVRWGDGFPSGHRVNAPVSLFPRIDPK
jgi:methionyl-tRNA synthetase